ncbi:MAG: oligosaccharide flippase family protein, partial [Methanosarcinales archaeon]|nr:oligosaccharide flippase family protein [Methanosarcinales archaeon]
FSSLSSIQEDKERVRYAYIRATRYIAAITFPLMIGLLALAPQFVMVVFGPQWERSIFLLQVFALIGLIQSVGTTVGWIYQSQGRADIMFRWGLFSVSIIVPAIVLGLRWGVEGVTIAYATAAFLLLYPALAIPFKLIDLKFTHFIKQFKSISLSAIGMGGIIFALSLFMENNLGVGNLIILVSSVIIGIASYAGILFVLDRNLYKEVFELLRELRS